MIKITRKVDFEGRMLYIVLGKHWEIEITRTLEEDMGFGKTYGKKEDKGFTRYVKEGGIIPRWYGYATREFDRDVSIYLPIPLNLIRAGWEWFKWHILFKFRSEWPHWMDQKHIDIRDCKFTIDTLANSIDITFEEQVQLHKVSQTLDRLRGL